MASSSLPPFDQSSNFAYTQSPHPSWSLCDKTETLDEAKEWVEKGEEAGWKVIDAQNPGDQALYPLFISGIVPRPIAFVSSISANGTKNLAPFSWFNQVTTNPPVISIGISAAGPDARKDTTKNILETKEFAVNIMSEAFVEQANSCSIDAPFEVSEWDVSGLTEAPSEAIKPSRVKESAFSMECTLFQEVPIIHPDTNVQTSTLVLGLVKRIHVRKDVLTEKGTVDIGKFKPVSRLGDISYGRTSAGYRIPRPVWKEVGEEMGKKIDEGKK